MGVGKLDTIRRIAADTGLSQGQVDKVIEAFLDKIARDLDDTDEFKYPVFGTFRVVERAARKGRNPKTGEAISIPARWGIKFRASRRLRKTVGAD